VGNFCHPGSGSGSTTLLLSVIYFMIVFCLLGNILCRFGNILASCSYDQRVIIWQEGGGQWSKIYEYTNHDSSVNRSHYILVNKSKTLPEFWFFPVLRIRIRDLVLFDPWIRDPGWVKNQDPDPCFGSEMNISIIFPRA
jgi:hypothetical protein